MKTMIKTMLLAGAAMVVASGANAATTFSFDFGLIQDTAHLTTGDLGLTAIYKLAGVQVTASAFGTPLAGVADHLYGKNLGTGETGLGMTNDPAGQDEIAFGSGFVQLDLNALGPNVKPNSVFAAFNSTSGGEQWKIYGSNTAGTLGSVSLPSSTFINSGVTQISTQLTGGFRYYDFVSGVAKGGTSGGNVLLKSLAVTVPEPDTWALMIVGFGGLGAVLRRRRALAGVAAA